MIGIGHDLQVATPNIARPRIPHEVLFAIGGWSGGTPTNYIGLSALKFWNIQYDSHSQFQTKICFVLQRPMIPGLTGGSWSRKLTPQVRYIPYSIPKTRHLFLLE